jgi:hypothetical protein
MKAEFKLGQIVKSKHQKSGEKIGYYLVIQEEDDKKQLVIQLINGSKGDKSGTAYTPIAPDDDLEHIEIKASDLVNEQIIIKETLFNELVTSKASHYLEANEIIRFSSIGDDLVSNVEFEFCTTNEQVHRCKGSLYYEMHHKEMFLKKLPKNEYN